MLPSLVLPHQTTWDIPRCSTLEEWLSVKSYLYVLTSKRENVSARAPESAGKRPSRRRWRFTTLFSTASNCVRASCKASVFGLQMFWSAKLVCFDLHVRSRNVLSQGDVCFDFSAPLRRHLRYASAPACSAWVMSDICELSSSWCRDVFLHWTLENRRSTYSQSH